MTAVVELRYSTEHFHQLDYPKRTLKLLKPLWMDAIFRIQSVFQKYNMDKICMLALIHRHHDLLDEERLIEVVDNDESITEAMIPSPDDELLSHIWELRDGKLFPFEYLNVSKSPQVDVSAFRANHDLLMNSGDFVTELQSILTETGTSHILGLQLIHRDGLLKPGESLSESSLINPRQSIVTSVAVPPACNVPVTWKMGPENTFCENCIPDWDTCGGGEDPDMEVPKKIACASSNCGCGGYCYWTEQGHCHSRTC